ncbi:hypothetical protein T492DRAFT_876010, partial [Pavlovales sp. CCMP2436]
PTGPTAFAAATEPTAKPATKPPAEPATKLAAEPATQPAAVPAASTEPTALKVRIAAPFEFDWPAEAGLQLFSAAASYCISTGTHLPEFSWSVVVAAGGACAGEVATTANDAMLRLPTEALVISLVYELSVQVTQTLTGGGDIVASASVRVRAQTRAVSLELDSAGGQTLTEDAPLALACAAVGGDASAGLPSRAGAAPLDLGAFLDQFNRSLSVSAELAPPPGEYACNVNVYRALNGSEARSSLSESPPAAAAAATLSGAERRRSAAQSGDAAPPTSASAYSPPARSAHSASTSHGAPAAVGGGARSCCRFQLSETTVPLPAATLAAIASRAPSGVAEWEARGEAIGLWGAAASASLALAIAPAAEGTAQSFVRAALGGGGGLTHAEGGGDVIGVLAMAGVLVGALDGSSPMKNGGALCALREDIIGRVLALIEAVVVNATKPPSEFTAQAAGHALVALASQPAQLTVNAVVEIAHAVHALATATSSLARADGSAVAPLWLLLETVSIVLAMAEAERAVHTAAAGAEAGYSRRRLTGEMTAYALVVALEAVNPIASAQLVGVLLGERAYYAHASHITLSTALSRDSQADGGANVLAAGNGSDNGMDGGTCDGYCGMLLSLAPTAASLGETRLRVGADALSAARAGGRSGLLEAGGSTVSPVLTLTLRAAGVALADMRATPGASPVAVFELLLLLTDAAAALPPETSVCAYWNEASGAWADEGIKSVLVAGPRLSIPWLLVVVISGGWLLALAFAMLRARANEDPQHTLLRVFATGSRLPAGALSGDEGFEVTALGVCQAVTLIFLSLSNKLLASALLYARARTGIELRSLFMTAIAAVLLVLPASFVMERVFRVQSFVANATPAGALAAKHERVLWGASKVESVCASLALRRLLREWRASAEMMRIASWSSRRYARAHAKARQGFSQRTPLPSAAPRTAPAAAR